MTEVGTSSQKSYLPFRAGGCYLSDVELPTSCTQSFLPLWLARTVGRKTGVLMKDFNLSESNFFEEA